MGFTKVLVIDDDKSVQLIAKVGLVDLAKLEVLLCSSASEGLAQARSFQPDLILMDIMMPEMTGTEALEVFRSISQFKDIPIVIMSAMSGSSNLDEYYQLGATAVICKPLNPSNLGNQLLKIYQKT